MDQQKIDRAIKLLQSIHPNNDDKIELCYSGGKDSDVILELAKMAEIKYRVIYKNTTIDPPGTIKHCRDVGAEIIRPQKSFLKLIEEHGFPTMRARFCCDKLKEYKVLDNAIQGIRKSESIKRSKLYKEPVICRIYGNKKNHVNVFLPILDWSNKDIEDFINMRKIKCHPLYYNPFFDVKKRLGCMGCPLKSDRGLSDFKQYPYMVKAWIRAGNIWWNKSRKKPNGCQNKFDNIYELFVHNIFFNSYEDFNLAKKGMFGTIDCKAFLEYYFKIKL